MSVSMKMIKKIPFENMKTWTEIDPEPLSLVANMQITKLDHQTKNYVRLKI